MATSATPPEPAAAPVFRQLLLVWLAIAASLSSAFTYADLSHFQDPGANFLIKQDLPVLVLFVVLAWMLSRTSTTWSRTPRVASTWPASVWIGLLAMACLTAGVFGAPYVFEGYRLSLDEFLATFDARIFARGELMAPLDPAWRPFANALQPSFMLPVPGHAAWASAYLPVHAALRALAARAHAEALVNPLLSAFSIVATYGVGRRLWPDDRRTALIAAALLAVSPQLILMAMTAYATPAHLAFNLAWLWLFLRGGRLGHVGALVVAFFATGLHQLAFHPAFAAPFVVQLWLDRRWRLAGAYTLAYAAICGFWLEYWPIELRLAGLAPHAAAQTGAGWFGRRVVDVLGHVQFGNLGAMAEGLVRFVTWQAPLTAPLVVMSAAAAVRAGGALRALLAGIVLTLMIALIATPDQMHGWGYRYLHGLLGSVCLLAAWSWSRLTKALAGAADAVLLATCAASLLLLTPLRAWQARSYNHPYVVAASNIARSRADVVLIAHDGPQFFDVGTLLRNDPFLANTPKVMLLSQLDVAQLRALCQSRRVAVIDGADVAAAGVDVTDDPPPSDEVRERRALPSLGCRPA